MINGESRQGLVTKCSTSERRHLTSTTPAAAIIPKPAIKLLIFAVPTIPFSISHRIIISAFAWADCQRSRRLCCASKNKSRIVFSAPRRKLHHHRSTLHGYRIDAIIVSIHETHSVEKCFHRSVEKDTSSALINRLPHRKRTVNGEKCVERLRIVSGGCKSYPELNPIRQGCRNTSRLSHAISRSLPSSSYKAFEAGNVRCKEEVKKMIKCCTLRRDEKIKVDKTKKLQHVHNIKILHPPPHSGRYLTSHSQWLHFLLNEPSKKEKLNSAYDEDSFFSRSSPHHSRAWVESRANWVTTKRHSEAPNIHFFYTHTHHEP